MRRGGANRVVVAVYPKTVKTARDAVQPVTVSASDSLSLHIVS